MSEFHRHKPGTSKQVNKSFKGGRHRSKGDIKNVNKGRVTSADERATAPRLGIKAKDRPDSKAQRRARAKQVAQDKRTQAALAHRTGHLREGAPRVVALVALSLKVNLEAARESIVAACGGVAECSPLPPHVASAQRIGATVVRSSRFKSRLALLTVQNRDPMALLDVGKVADLILFVMDAEVVRDDEGLHAISLLKAQGMPASMAAIQGLHALAPKKAQTQRTRATQFFHSEFLNEPKVLALDSEEEAQQVVRFLSEARVPQLHWRAARPYVLVERVNWQPNAPGDSFGTLQLSGYLRGAPLQVNYVAHLTGYGDALIDRIEGGTDPYAPLKEQHHPRAGGNAMPMATDLSLAYGDVAKAELEQRETLARENTPDTFASEQTWPTREELELAEKERRELKLVPKGTSAYQATWIPDDFSDEMEQGDDMDQDGDENDKEDNEDDDDSQGAVMPGDEDEDNGAQDVFKAGKNNNKKKIKAMERGALPIRDVEEEAEAARTRLHATMDQDEDEDDNEDNEDNEEGKDGLSDVMMDDAASHTSRRTARRERRRGTGKGKGGEEEALKDEEDEEMNFPDEVQTPEDMAARIRFQKFRGLKSFRTSPWDPKENLPFDYARIFAFENFRRTQQQVLARHTGLDPEQYVTVHLSNVAAAQFANHPRHMPLILSGLLKHEQKFSVVNFAVQRAISYPKPVRNKAELLFHVGFRRYLAEPTYSEASINSDKFKMERFFRGPAVATVFAPICYHPTPLVLTTNPAANGGALELVGSGSLLSVDPDRIILKKVILSGIPVKINKRRAVIKHMFFSPEDVRWFRPVEVWTKHGRVGAITDPLGTHGYMKCKFDSPVAHSDTVCMSLYKRVFPKWATVPELQHPPSNNSTTH